MSNHTLIIAEAGVNHNGSLDIAKQLIDAAVDAGVDIIKFQTFKADKLVSKDAKKAEYQKKNIGDGDDSQYQMLKKLELSDADHQELVAYCHQKGIRFWSTAFDLESIDFLHSLGLGLWKIPSGEITNYPFIKKIALLHEPVIMSTGMCNEEDIRNAMEVLLKNGLTKEQITILHCNTQYPTPMKDVNLKAMLTIKQDFGTIVGYSDHTQGIEVPIAAVALGAQVIEKHFTLDRNMGTGIKQVSESERANIAVARKSIVASTFIKKGETLSDDNLAVKRPGTGITPMRWEEVVGTKAIKDYQPDEQIQL